MTLLTVWPDERPGSLVLRTEDTEAITAELKRIGVRFERWAVVEGLPREATEDEILAAYGDRIGEVVEAQGYRLVDTMRMTPSDDPALAVAAAASRAKFLDEHTHGDDEDRFFARGSAVYYLHVGEHVYAVLCEAGDLLSIPADTTHWFDMGTRPDYVSIRFFHSEDGWAGHFTGSKLSSRFAGFDALTAARWG
ncbi:1,2-dihydroxy-3-keto-5-methylthiopentene dioxygenase [Amycolatopsis sp. H20-H5]|uniref:1,2-dihydroxy-3-keto-5-methylthiopentene dioxygenase n=1 Tax=Amycolatopsis sp. H20-H5 TaxID=3046309 RepID=UPI002DB848DC|nr:cupin [Amycolatopsis sp. H20-H5]MEC3981629.1 cupin [Amycolatopsis sp. H20-H5]